MVRGSEAVSLGEAIKSRRLRFKPWLKDFSPEVFEVDFSEVIRGRGHAEYRDPNRFFEITVLTTRMLDVLQWSLARTAGIGKKAVIHLATGFGGGKSHLLVMLYHVFTSRRVPDPQILATIGIEEVPDAKVVAVDGHNLQYPLTKDPVLGKYLAPTKEETRKRLSDEGRPVVFLIDEIVVYTAKLDDKQKTQEKAHLHTFIEAVNSTDNCLLVVAVAKGTGVYDEEAAYVSGIIEAVATTTDESDMASLFGRVTQPIQPVGEADFTAILKKRLVDYIDAELAKAVENEVGKKTGLDCIGSYPFHPALIDVLYSRVSLYRDFQQTRDALKVVALGIKGILRHVDDVESLMISPAELLFDDPDLVAILTDPNVFGTGLRQAVTKDVVTAAREADSGKRFGIFGRATAALFLYSLHPDPDRQGATPDELLRCLPDIVGKADMARIIETFFMEYSTFLWSSQAGDPGKKRYWFKSRPNVPNLIRHRKGQISSTEVRQYVEKTLFPTVFETSSGEDDVCLFLRHHKGLVPSHGKLNIVVPLYWENVDAIVEDMLEITGRRRNTVVVMIPDVTMGRPLEDFSRHHLAALRVMRTLSDKREKREAESIAQAKEAQALQTFRGMYTKMKYLSQSKKRVCSVHPVQNRTMCATVVSRLREVDKVFDPVNMDIGTYVTALIGARSHVQVRQLLEDVDSMLGIPFATPSQVRSMVAEAVYQGVIGLVEGDFTSADDTELVLHYREMNVSVHDGDTVVTEELAREIRTRRAEARITAAAESPHVATIDSKQVSPTIQETAVDKSSPAADRQTTLTSARADERLESVEVPIANFFTELDSRITRVLLEHRGEARAEFEFRGALTGNIVAGDISEINLVKELAQWMSRRGAHLLPGTRVTIRLYIREEGS